MLVVIVKKSGPGADDAATVLDWLSWTCEEAHRQLVMCGGMVYRKPTPSYLCVTCEGTSAIEKARTEVDAIAYALRCCEP